MRLLRVRSNGGKISLSFEEFHGSDIPSYAILSHTWEQEEVSYDDFVARRGPRMKGYSKIIGFAKKALRHELDYLWVDTCCIDKRSSAELSEAINSMYKWYENSTMCFAYLADVPEKEFGKSRWFSRGWTLQELIAPAVVRFYDAQWNYIFSKANSREVLRDITGISVSVLEGTQSVSDVSIVVRMTWAAHRVTTRAEDTAYCLMGLFSVNMPLLYGEGTRAFKRLQEELARQWPDQSLLAWRTSGTGADTDLYSNPLAASPAYFKLKDGRVFTLVEMSLSSAGLSTEVWLKPHGREQGLYTAILCCTLPNAQNSRCSILLIEMLQGPGKSYSPRRFLRTRPDLLELLPGHQVQQPRETIILLNSQLMPMLREMPLHKLKWYIDKTYVRDCGGENLLWDLDGRFHVAVSKLKTGKVAAAALAHKGHAAVVIFGLSEFGVPWCELLQDMDVVQAFDDFNVTRSTTLTSTAISKHFRVTVFLTSCYFVPWFEVRVQAL